MFVGNECQNFGLEYNGSQRMSFEEEVHCSSQKRKGIACKGSVEEE